MLFKYTPAVNKVEEWSQAETREAGIYIAIITIIFIRLY